MTRFFQTIFVILAGFSVVFPAVFAQEGAFGVRQVDPFRKNETPQNTEKRPNMFQEILDRAVELPSRRRPPAPPKKQTDPFEDAEEDWGDSFGGTNNPFEDADDPFGGNPFGNDPFEGSPLRGNISNPSNPFAAGDPFADEDPRNQGENRVSASRAERSTVDPNLAVLEIPGGPSLSAPERGYVWAKATSMDIDGFKADVYTCLNPRNLQEGTVITLTHEHREIKGDDAKIATLKGHYNGLYESIKNGFGTIVNETRPSLTPPIPKTVPYTIQAKDKNVMGTTVFSKNVYMILVLAPTKAETQRVMDFLVKHFD